MKRIIPYLVLPLVTLVVVLVMLSLGCGGDKPTAPTQPEAPPAAPKPCRYVHPDTGDLMALWIRYEASSNPPLHEWDPETQRYETLENTGKFKFVFYVYNTSGEYVFDNDLWIGLEFPRGAEVQWSGLHSILLDPQFGGGKAEVGNPNAYGTASFLVETTGPLYANNKPVHAGYNLYAEWRDGTGRTCEIKLTMG